MRILSEEDKHCPFRNAHCTTHDTHYTHIVGKGIQCPRCIKVLLEAKKRNAMKRKGA